MSREEMDKPVSVEAVLAQRAKRSAPRFAPVNSAPGAHVWAASGLVGWPGSSPTNVFAQSGLADAYAAFRAKQRDPSDWVPTVANVLKEKR
jgi:hypothetical protein